VHAALALFFKTGLSKALLLPSNRYCCRCGIHGSSCQELLPNKEIKVQDKSSTEFRLPEPLLIANYSRRLQRPATLAAIPMLCAVAYYHRVNYSLFP
jgi:hypothetical protein